jgi:SAM-dependent methyltransferase
MRAPAEVPAGVVLEDAACPMGCARDDRAVLVGRDRLHGLPGAFPVVECRGCGLLRTNPRPDLASIGVYYPEVAYMPYQQTRVTAVARAGWWPRLQRAWRLDGTRELVPPIAPGRALELGCASGAFMQKMRRRGWEVCGVEPSPAAAAAVAAAGFPVHAGALETAADGFASELDLTVASHSVEHLHQPLDALARVRRWSRPGAWLCCALPDAGSALFRRFGAAWYDLDLPRHLFHFSPRTLGALLARAGWRVVRVTRQRTLNSAVASLGYRLQDGGRAGLGGALLRFPESSSPIKKLTEPLAWLLAAGRQSGRMVVWARTA